MQGADGARQMPFFVQASAESVCLLRFLLHWAREHWIHTVAEDIETEDETKQVTAWRFHTGQGYYWGRPVARRADQ